MGFVGVIGVLWEERGKVRPRTHQRQTFFSLGSYKGVCLPQLVMKTRDTSTTSDFHLYTSRSSPSFLDSVRVIVLNLHPFIVSLALGGRVMNIILEGAGYANS